MTITPAIQIELAIYNAGITRSRREYLAHPTACANWCGQCVRPVASNPANCPRCRETLRERRKSAKRRREAR